MSSLAGRRIVVTREESHAGPLSSALRESGAVPLPSPTVEIAALHAPRERAELLPSLEGFDWLVVTSPRTVRLMAEVGVFRESRPPGLRIAVAGSRTADALAEVGWSADRVPRKAGAEPLLKALLEDEREARTTPGPVFFPASTQAGTVLPDGLTRAGFAVHRVDLYAPRARPQDPTWWRDALGAGLDALTFTSPSAVAGLTHGLADPRLHGRLLCLPAGVQGPTTAAAAREAGWTDLVEARPRTFHGLVAALESWFPTPSDPALTTPDPLGTT